MTPCDWQHSSLHPGGRLVGVHCGVSVAVMGRGSCRQGVHAPLGPSERGGRIWVDSRRTGLIPPSLSTWPSFPTTTDARVHCCMMQQAPSACEARPAGQGVCPRMSLSCKSGFTESPCLRLTWSIVQCICSTCLRYD